MRQAIVLVALMVVACADPLISEAKDAVKAKLKDPYSAKFENVRKCDGGKVVVGTINAKNAMGAYSGAEQFIYRPGAGGVSLQADFAELWPAMLPVNC